MTNNGMIALEYTTVLALARMAREGLEAEREHLEQYGEDEDFIALEDRLELVEDVRQKAMVVLEASKDKCRLCGSTNISRGIPDVCIDCILEATSVFNNIDIPEVMNIKPRRSLKEYLDIFPEGSVDYRGAKAKYDRLMALINGPEKPDAKKDERVAPGEKSIKKMIQWYDDHSGDLDPQNAYWNAAFVVLNETYASSVAMANVDEWAEACRHAYENQNPED